MTSKLLLAGFEDWLVLKGGIKVPNPGRLIVEEAQNNPNPWLEASGQARLETVLLPVPNSGDLIGDFRAFRERLDPVLAELMPQDTALFMGQGPVFQAPVRIETRGRNLFQSPSGEGFPIDAGGPEMVSVSAEVLAQLQRILEQTDFADKLELSEDAGTYYCNATLFLGRAPFAHFPTFLVGQEEEAGALWERNRPFFERKYPGKGPGDIAFGTTAEQARLLQAFLRATRVITAV